jgi:hypothetical protein
MIGAIFIYVEVFIQKSLLWDPIVEKSDKAIVHSMLKFLNLSYEQNDLIAYHSHFWSTIPDQQSWKNIMSVLISEVHNKRMNSIIFTSCADELSKNNANLCSFS